MNDQASISEKNNPLEGVKKKKIQKKKKEENYGQMKSSNKKSWGKKNDRVNGM
ncbi:hypothetical protein [Methanosarcina sp.]|uniref:hypothetical protein n=1 Tax=Methanosarcina sp. TaxID=2213 RepID=UPI003C78D22D